MRIRLSQNELATIVDAFGVVTFGSSAPARSSLFVETGKKCQAAAANQPIELSKEELEAVSNMLGFYAERAPRHRRRAISEVSSAIAGFLLGAGLSET